MVPAAVFPIEYAEKGCAEYSGYVSYANGDISDVKSITFQLTPEVDYFIEKNISMGVALIHKQTRIETGGSVTSSTSDGLALLPNLILGKSGNIYPYAGITLGKIGTDVNANSMVMSFCGLRAGIKIEVSKGAFVDTGLSYISYFDKGSELDLMAGISFYDFEPIVTEKKYK